MNVMYEDQIKIIDFRFERRQIVGFRKGEEDKKFNELQVHEMNDDLWIEFMD